MAGIAGTFVMRELVAGLAEVTEHLTEGGLVKANVGHVPQGIDPPYIRVSSIVGDYAHYMQGSSGYVRSTCQVDLWDFDSVRLNLVSQAMRYRLQQIRGDIEILGQTVRVRGIMIQDEDIDGEAARDGSGRRAGR